MLEHTAPLAVDAAMTLIGEHQVEVPRRVLAVDVHHALQRGDGDALLVLETPAAAQHVARVVGKIFGERIFGLIGKRDPIDDEEHTRHGIRFKEPLDERRGGAGLACARGHLDEKLPPAGGKLAAKRIEAIDLIVALDDAPVDGNGERIASHDRGRDPALEIRLREERLDPPRVGLVLPVPETDLLAIREKHVRDAEVRRVGLGLRFGDAEDRLCALGFNDCERPAVSVAEHVIRASAVGHRDLAPDGIAIGEIPALLLQLGIDLDPRERLVRRAHALPRPTPIGSAHPVLIAPGIPVGRGYRLPGRDAARADHDRR
jgi:hypothetical protein